MSPPPGCDESRARVLRPRSPGFQRRFSAAVGGLLETSNGFTLFDTISTHRHPLIFACGAVGLEGGGARGEADPPGKGTQAEGAERGAPSAPSAGLRPRRAAAARLPGPTPPCSQSHARKERRKSSPCPDSGGAPEPDSRGKRCPRHSEHFQLNSLPLLPPPVSRSPLALVSPAPLRKLRLG